MTTTNEPPPLFLRLPREIRDIIYSHALHAPPRWARRHQPSCPHRDRTGRPEHPLPLMTRRYYYEPPSSSTSSTVPSAGSPAHPPHPFVWLADMNDSVGKTYLRSFPRGPPHDAFWRLAAHPACRCSRVRGFSLLFASRQLHAECAAVFYATHTFCFDTLAQAAGCLSRLRSSLRALITSISLLALPPLYATTVSPAHITISPSLPRRHALALAPTSLAGCTSLRTLEYSPAALDSRVAALVAHALRGSLQTVRVAGLRPVFLGRAEPPLDGWARTRAHEQGGPVVWMRMVEREALDLAGLHPPLPSSPSPSPDDDDDDDDDDGGDAEGGAGGKGVVAVVVGPSRLEEQADRLARRWEEREATCATLLRNVLVRWVGGFTDPRPRFATGWAETDAELQLLDEDAEPGEVAAGGGSGVGDVKIPGLMKRWTRLARDFSDDRRRFGILMSPDYDETVEVEVFGLPLGRAERERMDREEEREREARGLVGRVGEEEEEAEVWVRGPSESEDDGEGSSARMEGLKRIAKGRGAEKATDK